MTGTNCVIATVLLSAFPLRALNAMDDSCLFENNKGATARISYTCTLANGDGTCDSSGSGFIISESGLVITNDHVIRPPWGLKVESEVINIKVAGRGSTSLPATVVGRDKVNDIALLRLPPRNDGEPWQSVAIGTSVPTQVGAPLTALGFAGSELAMIPSGKKTAELAEVDGGYKPWWQTNLALNEGNSGGPVFGDNGTVIGISVAYKKSSQLVSYVIPIYYAKPFLDQAGAQAVTYGSCAVYPSCRLKINGIESYGVEVIETGESQSKKSSSPGFCASYLAKLQVLHPNADFVFLDSSQRTRSDNGHQQHIYSCSFKRREDPIYNSKPSEFCMK